MDSGVFKVLTELSFDNLFVIAGLGFIAVAVFGQISGKINPDTRGRIASGIVGACLLVSGIVWHDRTHGFRITSVLASPPRSEVVSCPAKLALQGIIEAAGSGGVIYSFEFSDGSTTPPEHIDFDRSDSKLVSQVWELSQPVSGEWVRLNTIAPTQMSSPPSAPFTVTCLKASTESGSSATDALPAPSSPPARTSAAQPPAKVAAVDPSTDSVQLGPISPVPGTRLTRGQPLTFNIAITYNLASADVAILSLSTAQFTSNAGGCDGGSELVDAIEVPISKGKHEAKVQLTWSGDTGQMSKGKVLGRGYVGFASMFWANNNGSRGERLKFFGISPDYCYPFGP